MNKRSRAKRGLISVVLGTIALTLIAGVSGWVAYGYHYKPNKHHRPQYQYAQYQPNHYYRPYYPRPVVVKFPSLHITQDNDTFSNSSVVRTDAEINNTVIVDTSGLISGENQPWFDNLRINQSHAEININVDVDQYNRN